MGEDGYTLTEMLVALLMMGLAMTGVAAAARLVGASETKASSTRAEALALRRLDQAVAPVLLSGGPYDVARDGQRDWLAGTAERLEAGRGPLVETRVRLDHDPRGVVLRFSAEKGEQIFSLRRGGRFAFRYIAIRDGAVTDYWPARSGDGLSAVALLKDSRPIAVFPVGRDQPLACAFDARIGACAPAGDAR